MDIEKAILVVNGDAKEFLVSDFKNKNALISLVSVFLMVLAPPVLNKVIGVSFFAYLLWLIPIALVYGLYLMFANVAVFYASKKDLLYVLGMFVLPLVALIIGVFINDTVAFIMFGLGIIAALYFFGLKSANANVLLNGNLNVIQQISVMVAKVFAVLLFVLALWGQVDRMMTGSEKKKKATTLAEHQKGRDEQIAGAIGIAVLAFIGRWFYKKSINARQVFEKRGMKFENAD